MSKRIVFLLAGLAVVSTPIPAFARHGGGHGGYAGGYHGGYYHGGYYHGGFYHPGFYRGYGFGFGLGIGFYAPYGYGWYGYGPYVPYGVAVAAYPAAGGGVTAQGTDSAPSDTEQQRPAADNRAHLMLIVPADAEIEVAGQKMDQATGTEREVVSPPLSPGKRYSYAIRVRYTSESGKPVDETRTVYIRANDWWRVDFTRPAPKEAETLPAPKSESK
jgi:uncharacterized protein (TIGR03000 family)